MPNLSIISKELKDLDYESYLIAIFSLKKDFSKIASLFLLQNQLKKIHDLTKEDIVGLIRIAWFKEAISTINNQQNYPLLKEIAKFQSDLNLKLLNVAIAGFERDFSEEKKFKNAEELENYIFQTYEIFYLLILQLIVPDLEQNLQKKLARNLAQIGFYTDLLKKIKLNDETITRFFFGGFFGVLKVDLQIWQKNQDEENLQLIAQHICGKVEMAILEVESLQSQLPSSTKGLILKAKIAKIHLNKLKKNDFNIFKTNLSMQGFLVKLRLLSNF